MAISLLLIEPRFSVLADGKPGIWAAHDQDEPAFSSARAIELGRRAGGPDRFLVAGSSLMRAALGREADVERTLGGILGRPVEVALLNIADTTPMHMLALLETATARRGGMVLLAVNELMLGVTPREQALRIARQPLPLASPAAAKLAGLSAPPPRDGAAPAPFSRLHALRFYAVRLSSAWRNLAGGVRHSYDPRFGFERRGMARFTGGPVRSAKELRGRRAADYLREARTNAGRVLDQLRVLIRRLRTRPDVRIALVLDTINPVLLADRESGGELSRLRGEIEDLARGEGVALISAFRDAGIEPGAFLDYGHVVGEGSRTVLARALAESLRRQMAEGH